MIPLNKDKIPFTLIAFEESSDEPSSSTKRFLGTATLKYAGMEEYRKEAVWLSSIFTDPAERNKGVATALIQSAINIAEKFNVETIMLCTHMDGSLYEKWGWKTIDTVHYRGKSTLIMKRRAK